ncbi:hypothetical protein KAR91_25730 [Candidatus Pacearchaeota archaeon]|nr:hypothetical protein [Candidatus Pacearchaeota archaeon]
MKEQEKINRDAIRHMEYSIRAFAKAAIYASTSIREFDKYLNQMEIIRKEKRRIKRREFWWKVKNLPTIIRNKFKR